MTTAVATTTVYFESSSLPGWWSIGVPSAYVESWEEKDRLADAAKEVYDASPMSERLAGTATADTAMTAFHDASKALEALQDWIEKEIGIEKTPGGEYVQFYRTWPAVRLSSESLLVPQENCTDWEDRNAAEFSYSDAGELARILGCRPDWSVFYVPLAEQYARMNFEHSSWHVGFRRPITVYNT
ncbi:MAG: hypothetical protein AAFN18_11935 [Cyanobacteria bacterium J06554_6]